MEKNKIAGIAQDDAAHTDNWQHAEKKSNTESDTEFDLRSAEANGYGTENNLYAEDNDDSKDDDDLFDDDDDVEEDDLDEDDNDEDNNEEDDDDTISDWGTYDPQNNGMPSDNDPTAPGSAV